MRITAVRVAVLVAALSAAPAVLAQEAQPFSNTSGEAIRVVSADGDGAHGLSIRADGDAGSAKTHVHQSGPPVTEKTPNTQLLHGRLALSYDFSETWAAFGSVYSSYTSLQRSQFTETQASKYARVNPYHNWGDLAGGARWRAQPRGDLHFGAEGGAMFYGAANGLFSSPDFGATSPFARGLLTWNHDLVRVNANAGFFYDQSFVVWSKVFKSNTELQDGRTKATEIYPEERQMLGIYGKTGSTLRLLGGASVGYDLNKVNPFVETSFEETDGSLVVRVSPGLSFALADKSVHLLFAADVAPLAGDSKVGPLEPAVAVRGALAWEFGANPHTHTNVAPHPTPIPNNTPPPRHTTITVEVMTDDGKPLHEAKVIAVDALGAARQWMTDEQGRATVDEGSSKIVSIRAELHDYAMLSALTTNADHPVFTSPARITAVSVGSFEQVSLDFHDDHGNELPPKAIKITTIWGRGQRPFARTLGSSSYVDRVPATPGQDWKLQIENANAPAAPITLELNQPGTQITHHYIWDSANSRWTEGIARPPETAPMIIGNVFDPDLADVKPNNAAIDALVARLKADPALKAQITCAVKGGGDASFAESLAKARGDALLTYLKSKGIREAQIPAPKVDIKTEVDSVRVEFVK